MDHNEVPQLHACPTGHIASPNEVEKAKVKTEYKKSNNHPINIGHMKHKIRLVDEWSI